MEFIYAEERNVKISIFRATSLAMRSNDLLSFNCVFTIRAAVISGLLTSKYQQHRRSITSVPPGHFLEWHHNDH